MPGRRDADALLAALLLQAVELRAVEQLAEDLGDLLAHDAGAVVLHRDAEAVLGELGDLDLERRAGSPPPRRRRASCPRLLTPSAAPSAGCRSPAGAGSW